MRAVVELRDDGLVAADVCVEAVTAAVQFAMDGAIHFWNREQLDVQGVRAGMTFAVLLSLRSVATGPLERDLDRRLKALERGAWPQLRMPEPALPISKSAEIAKRASAMAGMRQTSPIWGKPRRESLRVALTWSPRRVSWGPMVSCGMFWGQKCFTRGPSAERSTTSSGFPSPARCAMDRPLTLGST